uniref:Fatty acid desaturase domain-containing protein n=1 Tax=Meloidogyne enterolobii TaxID=390850 RepID=A0A6V7ULU5_MELEN|nr:unnamed protein product [Meloidogyne enterolobii]
MERAQTESTTDCATIQPDAGLFIFIYILSASADTTDWLWGGLNYQIEHHLFPTMPRHNLKKVMPLVKEFCAKNNLPYMVDDYFTGFKLTIKHLHNVADIASEFFQRKLSGG